MYGRTCPSIHNQRRTSRCLACIHAEERFRPGTHNVWNRKIRFYMTMGSSSVSPDAFRKRIQPRQRAETVWSIRSTRIICSTRRSKSTFVKSWFLEGAKHRLDLSLVSYTISARTYAKSDTSFEDVTLKFFALRDKGPLREYLLAVLGLQKQSKVKAQICWSISDCKTNVDV